MHSQLRGEIESKSFSAVSPIIDQSNNCAIRNADCVGGNGTDRTRGDEAKGVVVGTGKSGVAPERSGRGV